MITIVDFVEEHIEQAQNIVKENYENERKCVDILPQINELPDFSQLAKNELGVSAFDGEKMVGYLCCFGPFENAFGTTNDTGVYSPVHGNGIVESDHKNIFARMYQAAAQKWVNSNITNHAITFYAHNGSIQNQLYRYGFGLRCIDAIRPMEELNTRECSNITFIELEHNDFRLIYPIGMNLTHHLWDSPSFLRYTEILEEEKDGDPDEFAKWQIKENFRYFAAKDKEKIIAYIKTHDEGDNFIGNVNNLKYFSMFAFITFATV
jgi:hypothetical protein